VKITLLLIGSTDKKYIKEGVEDYLKRVTFYVPFEMKIIPDIKNNRNLTPQQQKEKEGKALLDLITSGEELVLLDEQGLEMSSVGFAKWIEKRMINGSKQLTFLIGGPYGFSEAVYQRADCKISFSKMTFPHQLIRLIFAEQLYRAMTIIKGEPYHHE
jgi:23S rRNA (pseudouridine1915-N3)-methyltransferase